MGMLSVTFCGGSVVYVAGNRCHWSRGDGQ